MEKLGIFELNKIHQGAMRTFFYIFGITILFLMSCSKDREEDDLEFYEFSYDDSTFLVLPKDTINIVLINFRNLSRVDSNIVVEIRDKSMLFDTVKLNFIVFYEGYSPVPSPQKYQQLRKDTLYYWYGFSPIVSYKQYELYIVSSNNQIQTSPKPTYFSIQKVVIRKSPNKHVTFKLSYTILPL